MRTLWPHSLIAGMAMLFALAEPLHADDWRDKTNYPARVTAIAFGAQVLDSNHAAHFGSWTVAFGPEGLPLFNTCFGMDTFCSMDVSDRSGSHPDLLCTNATVGQTWCRLQFNLPDAQHPDGICLFWPSNMTGFPISCPTDMTFKR
jgi:hypothetical protein